MTRSSAVRAATPSTAVWERNRTSFDGGAGADIADYTLRQDTLIVDNDGVFDDGSGNEGDTVKPTMETIRGGAGNDQLSVAAPSSTPEINLLQGGQGHDELDVGDGGPRDLVDGGLGLDTCLRGRPAGASRYPRDRR